MGIRAGMPTLATDLHLNRLGAGKGNLTFHPTSSDPTYDIEMIFKFVGSGLNQVQDLVGKHIMEVEAPALSKMLKELDHLHQVAKTQALLADD